MESECCKAKVGVGEGVRLGIGAMTLRNGDKG